MTFGLVAVHYPRPENADDLVERVGRAAKVMATAPGCLDVRCWTDEASGAVVATAKFASKQTCDEALATAAATVDIAYDERERRPREFYHLIGATQAQVHCAACTPDSPT